MPVTLRLEEPYNDAKHLYDSRIDCMSGCPAWPEPGIYNLGRTHSTAENPVQTMEALPYTSQNMSHA